MPATHSHQLETLRLYKRLVDFREDWAGAIVFCCGPGCALSGISPAASIAGAVSLAVDEDALGVKQAFRRGELDFIVNTLDEALRTLKNEVRKHRPLSVGLIANIDNTLAEMIERGVQPDVQLVPPSPSYAGVDVLRDRGMKYFYALVADDPERPSRTVPILDRKRHYEYFFAAESPAALNSLDAHLRSILPQQDTIRRRWLQRVSHYLRDARDGGRWLWMNDEELTDAEALGLSPESR